MPETFLREYQGSLQTEGYEAYTEIGNRAGISHVGCRADVRSKLFDARQVAKVGPAVDGTSPLRKP